MYTSAIYDFPAFGTPEIALEFLRLQNIITLFVWNYTRRGLLDSDKLTVVSMMCMNILVRVRKTQRPRDTQGIPEKNGGRWLVRLEWCDVFFGMTGWLFRLALTYMYLYIYIIIYVLCFVFNRNRR